MITRLLLIVSKDGDAIMLGTQNKLHRGSWIAKPAFSVAPDNDLANFSATLVNVNFSDAEVYHEN